LSHRGRRPRADRDRAWHRRRARRARADALSAARCARSARDGRQDLCAPQDGSRRARRRQAAPLPLAADRAMVRGAQGGDAVMPPPITGATRLYAIIGDPIAQVRSPEVFTARFADAGIDAVMIPVRIPVQHFDTIAPALLALGNLD